MKTRAELKQSAKDVLRGHWGQAVGLNALTVILAYGSFGVSMRQQYANFNVNGQVGGGSFLVSVLAVAINFGVWFTFLSWIRQPKREVRPLRDAFSVIATPAVFALLLQWLIITFVVGIGLILLLIPGIIVGLMWSQAVYVYKDLHAANPDASVWQGIMPALSLSTQLMRGHKWEFFVLQLSFLGWILLGMLSLGIGFFWITPYINATSAAYYDELEASSNVELTM